jgi:hypothetical protein
MTYLTEDKVVYLDFFGVALAINDVVAVEQPGYRNLILARVVSFTPKKVRLKYYYQRSWHDYLCHPSDLVKAPSSLQKEPIL